MIKKLLLWRKFDKYKNKNPQIIKKEQFAKLQAIIKYAYENVEFYRIKFDNANLKPEDIKTPKDISKIPFTTKHELLTTPYSILSSKFDKNALKISKTSGSTGEPFVSYFDKDAWNSLKNFSKLRARFACGVKFGDFIVNIESESQEAIDEMNKKIKKFDFILKIRYLALSDKIEDHIKFYQKYKPKILYGYPSYFKELAHYIKDNNITYRPSIIFTSSEVLNCAARKYIESTLGAKVYDIYGSTETKEICWQCKMQEGYHINEDLYFVEIANNENSPYKKGEIVVTNLINRAMPLIRYRSGDTGMFLRGKCKCGCSFSLMKPIDGRILDYILLPNRERISPYIFMSLEDFEDIRSNVRQYQIIQEDADNLKILIKAKNKLSVKEKEKIVSIYQQILKQMMDVKVEEVDNIARDEKSGKFKLIKNKFA
jgi:phenylacetate-CoA ligase